MNTARRGAPVALFFGRSPLTLLAAAGRADSIRYTILFLAGVCWALPWRAGLAQARGPDVLLMQIGIAAGVVLNVDVLGGASEWACL